MYRASKHRRLKESRSAANVSAVDGKLVDVNVVSHSSQKHSAWLGGSIVASDSRFHEWMMTKEQYEEEGPRIARHSVGVYNTDSM
jgi:actin-related protein